jgi:hypothetical protein
MVWKDSGKKTSWLFQEAQEGKFSGMEEALGWNWQKLVKEKPQNKAAHHRVHQFHQIVEFGNVA